MTDISPNDDATANEPLLVLIPIFNEWDVAALLLDRLDAALAAANLVAEVVLIDDGSPLGHECHLPPRNYRSFARLDVLVLARNLGHQRAIAIGLAWIRDRRGPCRVILMDGDGEDDPADIPRLLAAAQADPSRHIIFAARTRRSERWTFQVCYRVYQAVHFVLTGRRVQVGNFSLIQPRALVHLSVMSELWNHYAAAVINSKIPFALIPCVRQPRLGGRSTMSFTALVMHGLSALSVFSHVIGVRLVTACLLFPLVLGGGLLALWLLPAAQRPLPDWLPAAIVLLLGLLGLQFCLALAFVLLILSGRQGTSFIPARDYRFFIARTAVVHLDHPAPI